MRLQKVFFADAVDNSLQLTVEGKIKELEKYVQGPKSTFRLFASASSNTRKILQ